ncbi:MAG TPA: hypothetical protein VFX60_19430 [Micromonospora sp.]|nr:hypothetical protein [Micromonospora sp.]
MTEAPEGLGAGGLALWKAIDGVHDLDAAQVAQLTEACRAKDRLDRLDQLLRGEIDAWVRVVPVPHSEDFRVQVDSVLDKANTTANLMKQLLAALRLPDEKTGKRPQYRGARGAQAPTVPGGKGSVTAMAKFRQAAGG